MIGVQLGDPGHDCIRTLGANEPQAVYAVKEATQTIDRALPSADGSLGHSSSEHRQSWVIFITSGQWSLLHSMEGK